MRGAFEGFFQGSVKVRLGGSFTWRVFRGFSK